MLEDGLLMKDIIVDAARGLFYSFIIWTIFWVMVLALTP